MLTMPPSVTSGEVLGADAKGRLSTMRPAVVNDAVAPRTKFPRVGSGGGVCDPGVLFKVMSVKGEKSGTVKLKLPPGAVIFPSMSTFAPTREIDPPATVVSETLAGMKILPSLLSIRRTPKPSVLTKSGDRI